MNCLRAVPGRGIRVWGARTLSGDPTGSHIGARRVFLTMGRWLERFLTQLAFEPNDVRLWVRIMRELTAYLDGLFQGGALKGRTPEEAFFVKCDSETNPPEVTGRGDGRDQRRRGPGRAGRVRRRPHHPRRQRRQHPARHRNRITTA